MADGLVEGGAGRNQPLERIAALVDGAAFERQLGEIDILTALDAMGRARPREATVGVNIGYATATFEIAERHARKAVFTFPSPPRDSRCGLPVEGNRWMAKTAALPKCSERTGRDCQPATALRCDTQAFRSAAGAELRHRPRGLDARPRAPNWSASGSHQEVEPP